DIDTFYMSRHNLYSKSFDKRSCMQDWECNDEHVVCASADKACATGKADHDGSSCDPAAHRCTLPVRSRPTRAVEYRLSPHFPPYLVRGVFEAAAHWNEALMRGRRAALGKLPIDQKDCTDAEEQQDESDDQVK